MFQIAWGKASGLALDLRSGSVEDVGHHQETYVLCFLVLSHFEDLDGAVARLANCVAPGGKLIGSYFRPANILVGFRTSFTHDGTDYVVLNYLPSDYFDCLFRQFLTLKAFHEVSILDTYFGFPMALLLSARRPR